MNIDISIIEKGNNGPVIIWMMHPFEDGETEHLCECIEALDPDMEYVLTICNIDDWNGQLSPWSAGAVMGDTDFAGLGSETLKWLNEHIIPDLKRQFPDRKIVIAGYSLAGIFALWAGYETAAFDGIICCSGSLWFEGWEEYATSHALTKSCSVYLSLGGKEHKTSNPVMATILDKTKLQEKLLKTDPNAEHVTFELNSGGHFADSGKRLAKGIKWICTQLH